MTDGGGSPMSALDPGALRDAFGWFLTGVTVVTSRSAGGDPIGLTANSFSSVSLDPPLVLFSLARSADCFADFDVCQHFAVNVLASGQEALSTLFATKSADKWRGTGYRLGRWGSPLIAGTIAAFECRVEARHPGGDHIIYLGEVLALHAGDDRPPLGFFRGRYRSIS